MRPRDGAGRGGAHQLGGADRDEQRLHQAAAHLGRRLELRALVERGVLERALVRRARVVGAGVEDEPPQLLPLLVVQLPLARPPLNRCVQRVAAAEEGAEELGARAQLDQPQQHREAQLLQPVLLHQRVEREQQAPPQLGPPLAERVGELVGELLDLLAHHLPLRHQLDEDRVRALELGVLGVGRRQPLGERGAQRRVELLELEPLLERHALLLERGRRGRGRLGALLRRRRGRRRRVDPARQARHEGDVRVRLEGDAARHDIWSCGRERRTVVSRRAGIIAWWLDGRVVMGRGLHECHGRRRERCARRGEGRRRAYVLPTRARGARPLRGKNGRLGLRRRRDGGDGVRNSSGAASTPTGV